MKRASRGKLFSISLTPAGMLALARKVERGFQQHVQRPRGLLSLRQ